MAIQTFGQQKAAQQRFYEAVAKLAKSHPMPEKVYFVFYDLDAKTGRYAELEKRLKEMGASEIQESVYELKSRSQTAKEVWEQLKDLVDATKETMFIMEYSSNVFDSRTDS